MIAARDRGAGSVECSLDLQRSITLVSVGADHWVWEEKSYPYPERCKPRTVYFWDGAAFAPASRYAGSLVKLIPTDWGPPTFEIDGIKMLPTARISPYTDAEQKVALIEPRGKRILDTCGGLGYFAACAIQGQAEHVNSYEKNPDVIWLRQLNPWSPRAHPALTVEQGDVAQAVEQLQAAHFDAVLHDPPRFGIAGELYSLRFYQQLARVLRRHGRLFHYTGSPNKLTSGRDVPAEVSRRLDTAGFTTQKVGDGILAVKR